MHSNNLLTGTALLALLSISSAAFGQTGQTAKGHCLPEERVQFSCRINTKVVSLCAAGEPGAITSLVYRYGLPGKVENEFVARADNSNRFFATVSPASPGASVKQLWFDRGRVRYLLTECVGGNCRQGGGLAVLDGDRVVMNASCGQSVEGDQAWFARDLISFGAEDGKSDTGNVRSASELLKIEDADNNLEALFGRGAGGSAR